MKLNGFDFIVPDELFNEFFAVMDTFKKVVLSNDSNPKTLTKFDEDKYCIYEVADHIIGLPKEAYEKLKDFVVFVKK